jgi:hypothetical protein
LVGYILTIVSCGLSQQRGVVAALDNGDIAMTSYLLLK